MLKKLGYWLMIMVSFGASAIFVEIGDVLSIDLGVTVLLGCLSWHLCLLMKSVYL